MPRGSAMRQQGPDQGFSAARRLRAPRLFAEAYSQDRRFRGRHMMLWLRKGTDAALRLGVVSSRKVGAAVQRVRARRRLREMFRRHRAELNGAVDLVLVARASLVLAPWAEVEADFLELMGKAGLWANAPGRQA